MRRGLIAVLLAGFTLGGCATNPPSPGDHETALRHWDRHRQAVTALDSFQLRGRLAGSALGARADLRWQQAADGRFSLRVSGPFGAGALTLRGNAQQVQVNSRDGEFHTDDPEGWLREKLGWSLPLANLRWWALGLPAPSAGAQLEVNAEGEIVSLRQAGWQLRYENYRDALGQRLPGRLRAQQGEVEFRLLADQWLAHDEP